MACNTKIVTDIINSCKITKGIKPLAYWAYRKDLAFTKTLNEIENIWCIKLGSIQAIKFGLNAGFETVMADENGSGFKHKFSGVLNKSQMEIDELDDIVIFVQSNDGVWLSYGVEQGLWKISQAKMANDNLATIAVEFGSREGMEEFYSEYIITQDMALIPKFIDWGALTVAKIDYILYSCIIFGTYNQTLDVSGGTNAESVDWLSTSISYLAILEGRGWTITYN